MKTLNTLLAQFWIGVVKSLVHVPLSVRCGMAKGLAARFWWGIPHRRPVALTNIALFFTE